MASDWNTLMDGMSRTPLSSREASVLTAIARKTLGWRKPTDCLSTYRLAEATGLDRRHVNATVARLSRRGIVVRSGGRRGKAASVGINLNPSAWDGWRPLPDPEQLAPEPALVTSADFGTSADAAAQLELVPKSAPELVPKSAHTRGKGKTSRAGSAELAETKRLAFDAYQGSGGTLRSRERDVLAGNVKALVTAGQDRGVILAACRDLGRKREFPGLLKQRVKELADSGGPCQWEGMARLNLTGEQLAECGCNLCAEWAEAKAVAA